MMDDERFYKIVDKERFDLNIELFARQVQSAIGGVLMQCLNMDNKEEMKKLNDGDVMDMSELCFRFERAVSKRIVEIGIENGERARINVEASRRERQNE